MPFAICVVAFFVATSFQYGINHGRRRRLDVGLTMSDRRIFCAKLCTDIPGMPWSTWKRLVQKKKRWGKNDLLLRKHLTVVDLFEGL